MNIRTLSGVGSILRLRFRHFARSAALLHYGGKAFGFISDYGGKMLESVDGKREPTIPQGEIRFL